MNRLALIIPMILACSSTPLGLRVPDGGSPAAGGSGGNVVVPPASGGSPGTGGAGVSSPGNIGGVGGGMGGAASGSGGIRAAGGMNGTGGSTPSTGGSVGTGGDTSSATTTSTGGSIGSTTSRGNESVVGRWEETWGVGQVTDITYHDIYVITLGADGRLAFSAEGRPNYAFGDVQFDGKALQVTLDNDGFIIDYTMTLSADGDSFTGDAIDAKGTFNILWERIK